MIGTLFRLLWRLFVGCAAIGFAYVTAFLFFPYLKHRMPTLIVLVVLYIFVAYVGIPFLVRLWRIVLRPQHLPHYVVTGDGWPSDPVNIAVVCKNKQQLRRVMQQAGWNIADKVTVQTSARMAAAIFFNVPYPTAPFSSLYLFGRKQDIGFQIQTGSPASPRHRHHIRFWQLETPDGKTSEHVSFWDNVLRIFTIKKQQIWIGAATHDIKPFAFRMRNLQVTHQIDQETYKERDFVLTTLQNAGVVRKIDVIEAGDPISFRGQTFGVNIVTDGNLHVVEIKK